MDPSYDAVQRPPIYAKYIKPTTDHLFRGNALVEGWDESGVPVSFVMVLITEVGDKTFFLAMLLAMRHGKLAVFIGAMCALLFMTMGSAMAGFLIASSAEMLQSSMEVVDVCATILFGIFGIQLLLEAHKLHKKEVNEAEMRQLLGGEGMPRHGEWMDAEEALRESDERSGKMKGFRSAVWQTFTMMFVAEWGDRSMFATLALATQHNVVAVVCGAMSAHIIANLMAVIGGEMLAGVISEKVMALTGGCVFLFFACISAYEAISHNDVLSLV